MLVSGKRLLDRAQKGNYAVGAFNVVNMEVMQAVVEAARIEKSPVIVQTTEGAIGYAGLEYLYALGVESGKHCSMALHLDHGRDLKLIKKCIDIGYSSVMFDGSHLDFKKNIKTTKKVVQWAHRKGVSVEAELGTIGGVEEKISSRKIIYTEPSDAKEFALKTGCDSLAIAIGTSHGAYKFAGKSRLDIARLRSINKIVKIPLVLHGASSVPQWLVRKAGRYGAKLGKPHGVSEQQIAKAVRNGINKVNTDTDLRLCFDATIRQGIREKPEVFDIRKMVGPVRDALVDLVRHKIKVFGSRGKA
ncbi:MAG: class II fructose-bisphosphate aldolase [Candidatus Woesearchaeota archaeon]|jgi:fructose-bisphosphate aldolase class II|nr:class II fructose-bisphosphate aldolase [Candidatus Woesearchaeota archaeon]MDP7457171.1 class II fructose-bisphosphate aldolase [Candidatus Woesearchaeota archaeon]